MEGGKAMKTLSFVLLLLLAGCAFHRELYVSLECRDCKTPYGGGEFVNVTINKVTDTCK
jgi:hypothetical protein